MKHEEENQMEEALRLSMQCLEMGRMLFHKHNKLLAEFEDAAARLLVGAGRLHAALPHLERSITAATEIYGEG